MVHSSFLDIRIESLVYDQNIFEGRGVVGTMKEA